MKTITAVSAIAFMAALLPSFPTYAADLYKGGLKDAPPAIVADVPAWTGFYLGGNAGGGWSTISLGSVDVATDTGFVGGGQVGYNFQTGQFVFGIESDIGVVAFQNDKTNPLLVDVTGRLGYAAGPALFYAKGGWAYLDVANGLDGWVVGGGIEYKFNPSWSVKGEYQHFQFADIGGVSTLDLTADVVKVGLNYHLGSTHAPLK